MSGLTATQPVESVTVENLEAIELKFLLKLLNCEGHRGDISALRPNSKTSATKCDRICQTLAEQGLVEYDSEIQRFTISPPGRVLLRLQTTSLPVTPDELRLLRTCRGSMTMARLGNSVPASARQQLVQALVSRKLLRVVKNKVTEVRLTAQGYQLLTNNSRCKTIA